MSVQHKASNQARRIVASLLVPTEAPFKEYLKATDYCTAVMLYTDRPADYEYMVQWRAAFAALMVAGAERNRAIPDVPSAAEVGLPNYKVNTWYGIWAPKGMPADAQAAAIDVIRRCVQADEARAVWDKQGAAFPNVAGPQFASLIHDEIRTWAQVVKASGAKLE